MTTPRRTAAAATGAVCALLLVGCGGGSAGSSSSTTTQAGLAAGLSPHPSASLHQREVALHRQVLRSLHHVSHAKYGGIPTDLRDRQRAPAGQVLSASFQRPASPIQGIVVRLHLPHGSARAVVVGPYVPLKDQGSFHNFTTPYWEMTFSDVHGSVPLGRRLLTVVDEQGAILHPRVTVRGGGALPTAVPKGAPFTLRLTTRVSIGDGKVRYAPDGRLLAQWDFSAETD